MELKQSFGQALRILRTSRHLTQEDFSQVSSRTYLSSLERGLLACSYLLDEEHSLDDLLVRVRNELSGITLAE